MLYEIVKYRESDAKRWDFFVEEQSINGTFLQERRFLNYHGDDKFSDASLLFFLKGELVAVCPACEMMEGQKRIFYSHRGSTYGGFVIKQDIYKTEKLLQMLTEFEEYLIQQNYTNCILKPTMGLLCQRNAELLDFCLYYKNYREYKELNLYIDFGNYATDTIKNLSHMKQRIIRRCEREGLVMKELTTEDEIAVFYQILQGNLKKYEREPVHTLAELYDLYFQRINREVKFYGAYLGDVMTAGTMVFLFDKAKCAHTQYLAADLRYNKLSPMSFVYYRIAKLYGELGYKSLSWGITTEHLGMEVNMGLTKNKEDYGSIYTVNHIYEKYLV